MSECPACKLRGIPANGKTAHSLVPVGRVRAPRLFLALARVLAFCSSEAIDSSKYLPLLPSASSFVAWSLLRRRRLSWQLQTPLRSHRCAPDIRYRKQRVKCIAGAQGLVALEATEGRGSASPRYQFNTQNTAFESGRDLGNCPISWYWTPRNTTSKATPHVQIPGIYHTDSHSAQRGQAERMPANCRPSYRGGRRVGVTSAWPQSQRAHWYVYASSLGLVHTARGRRTSRASQATKVQVLAVR